MSIQEIIFIHQQLCRKIRAVETSKRRRELLFQSAYSAELLYTEELEAIFPLHEEAEYLWEKFQHVFSISAILEERVNRFDKLFDDRNFRCNVFAKIAFPFSQLRAIMARAKQMSSCKIVQPMHPEILTDKFHDVLNFNRFGWKSGSYFNDSFGILRKMNCDLCVQLINPSIKPIRRTVIDLVMKKQILDNFDWCQEHIQAFFFHPLFIEDIYFFISSTSCAVVNLLRVRYVDHQCQLNCLQNALLDIKNYQRTLFDFHEAILVERLRKLSVLRHSKLREKHSLPHGHCFTYRWYESAVLEAELLLFSLMEKFSCVFLLLKNLHSIGGNQKITSYYCELRFVMCTKLWYTRAIEVVKIECRVLSDSLSLSLSECLRDFNLAFHLQAFRNHLLLDMLKTADICQARSPRKLSKFILSVASLVSTRKSYFNLMTLQSSLIVATSELQQVLFAETAISTYEQRLVLLLHEAEEKLAKLRSRSEFLRREIEDFVAAIDFY